MARAPRKSPARKEAAGPPRRLGAPKRIGGGAKTFTSRPVEIEFAAPEHRLTRADLEIDGIFHGEASYEGRIFLNNPRADHTTPCDREHGYAGSFHVFGHGGCLGDPGHCDVSERRDRYDFRPPHPLTLASKRVTVTDVLRDLARTKKEVTVTVVPVISAANELCDTQNVFRFEDMRFVSYN
jgi:tyrosinase